MLSAQPSSTRWATATTSSSCGASAQIVPQVRLRPLPALDGLARQPAHVRQRAKPADAPARPQQAAVGELDARRAGARVQQAFHQFGIALDQEFQRVVRHLERRRLRPQPPRHVRARLAQGIILL